MNSLWSQPVMIVLKHLWRSYRMSLLIYTLIFFVVYMGINVMMNSNIIVSGEGSAEEISKGASMSPKFYLLVIGILLTPVSLAGFVSNGLTRRHFITGSGLFIAAMSLIFAIIIPVCFELGKIVFGALGVAWEQGQSLFGKSAEYFFLFLIYFGSGWLIGSLFYQFNWKAAIVLAALAYTPTVLAEMLLGSEGLGEWLLDWTGIGAPAAAIRHVSLLLVAAVVFLLNKALLSRVAIRRKMIM